MISAKKYRETIEWERLEVSSRKYQDRDTKRTLHAKMGTIKDRNGMDIIEAGDIKKRWQDYTEKLSSILAWRIPCTKEPCGLAHRVTESQT